MGVIISASMLVLRYFFGNLLYFFSLLWPKSGKIWVFGAWKGYSFSDNPRWVFEYVTLQEPDIYAVWLTHSPEVVEKLKSRGRRVYYINSFLGLWYMLRAGVGVVSHGLVDLNRYACARIGIIETWHGIPMKPVLLSDPKETSIRRYRLKGVLKLLFPFIGVGMNYSRFAAICGSSEFTNRILERVFGSNSNILSTGFPRLDGFYSTIMPDRIAYDKQCGKRVGIYMPTYRRPSEFNIVGYFKEEVEKLDKILNARNVKMYVRIHPFDLEKSGLDFSSYQAVELLDDSMVDDLYSVLANFDFLITDYSSILFDFLCLERPVFLLTPDRESYLSSNGAFVFDYFDLSLPIAKDWQSMADLLVGDYDIKRLPVLREKFHRFNDGCNSNRLVEEIKCLFNLNF